MVFTWYLKDFTFSLFNYVHKNTNLHKRWFDYHGYNLFHCCNKNLCVSTNTSTSFDPCSRYHRLLRYYCKNKSIFTKTLWDTPLTRKFRPEHFVHNTTSFFFFCLFLAALFSSGYNGLPMLENLLYTLVSRLLRFCCTVKHICRFNQRFIISRTSPASH